MYPHLNIDGVVGAVHLPADGQADPANIALALAKGARNRGALIKEGVRVTAVNQADGRVTGVQWASDTSDEIGTIEADVVINCGGMGARSRRHGWRQRTTSCVRALSFGDGAC